MILPYLKRVVDHCHSLGLYYEHHSCGKCELIIPAWIEAGVDLWCGQDVNDFDVLLERYKGSELAIGIPEPAIPQNAPEEKIREIAQAWVEKYKNTRAIQAFLAAPPSFSVAVYEFSRKAYENAE